MSLYHVDPLNQPSGRRIGSSQEALLSSEKSCPASPSKFNELRVLSIANIPAQTPSLASQTSVQKGPVLLLDPIFYTPKIDRDVKLSFISDKRPESGFHTYILGVYHGAIIPCFVSKVRHVTKSLLQLFYEEFWDTRSICT